MSVQTLITDYFPIHLNKKKPIYNQTLITDYFKKQILPDIDTNINTNEIVHKKNKKVYGFNSETNSWHCLDCGDDMGPSNPRQLCGKYYCCNLEKIIKFTKCTK